ncbi:sterol carrier protein 2 [Ancistrocladus abbreviatus]
MAEQLKSEALLEQMKLHLATDAGKQLREKIGLVYQFNIAPKKIGFDEVIYVVDLKKGEVKKGPYEDGKPDATFSFKDEDFVKIATGKMNPQIAFLRNALLGYRRTKEDGLIIKIYPSSGSFCQSQICI